MSNFIGLGDLATFMGVAVGAITSTLGELAIAAAQASVRKYIDQEITYTAGDVVQLDGAGKPWLRLPERPVRAVSVVEEATSTTGGLSYETVVTSDYQVRRSLLFRVDGGVWTPGNLNYRVTYSHGWDVGATDSDPLTTQLFVPADISLAALNCARRIYDALGSSDGTAGTDNIKQETIGSYSYTLAAGAEQVGSSAGVELITAEKIILDRYRIVGAG